MVRGRGEQNEIREAGEAKKKEKKTLLREITVPDLVTGSQCADVTPHKRSQSPMISNSLTMAARALHGAVRWVRDRYNKMGYCVWMGLR